MSIQVGTRTLPGTSPPWTLYPAGSYQIWAERGTYSVLGKYTVLSESKKRGPGWLRRGREIVFEYSHRGKKYTVTFRRRESVSPRSTIIGTGSFCQTATCHRLCTAGQHSILSFRQGFCTRSAAGAQATVYFYLTWCVARIDTPEKLRVG